MFLVCKIGGTTIIHDANCTYGQLKANAYPLNKTNQEIFEWKFDSIKARQFCRQLKHSIRYFKSTTGVCNGFYNNCLTCCFKETQY